MQKTKIEYLTHTWNPYSGCLHTLNECAIADKCWARAMVKRFHTNYPGGFEPFFYSGLLDEPYKMKKAARIGVAFMGDMFGDWNGHRLGIYTINQILETVRACPQHQFYFLTKAPWNLSRFNPWPANAWVGVSITGAERPLQQIALMRELVLNTEADRKWVSYEPLLGPLNIVLAGIRWLVIGAATGPGAVLPKREWVLEIVEAANKARIPIFIKNNLKPQWGQIVRQEYPLPF